MSYHPTLNIDQLPDSAYLRESQLVSSFSKEITGLLPFSSSTLWRKVSEGSFPKPYRIGARMTAWKIGEIRQWLSQQPQYKGRGH